MAGVRIAQYREYEGSFADSLFVLNGEQSGTVSFCMYVLDTPEYSVQRTYFSGVLYIYVFRTHTDGRHPRNCLNSTMDSLFIYLCKYSVLLIECSTTEYESTIYILYSIH